MAELQEGQLQGLREQGEVWGHSDPGPCRGPQRQLLGPKIVYLQRARLCTKLTLIQKGTGLQRNRKLYRSVLAYSGQQVESHHSLANSLVREHKGLNSGKMVRVIRRFLPAKLEFLILCLNPNWKSQPADRDRRLHKPTTTLGNMHMTLVWTMKGTLFVSPCGLQGAAAENSSSPEKPEQ